MPEITEAAKSGDGTVANVGIKLDGKVQCTHCNQRFATVEAMQLHLKFAYDPNRPAVG